MKSSVVFDLGLDLDPGDTEGGGIVRMANVLLCDEITKAWMWPMTLPVAAICQKARNTLVTSHADDLDKFNSRILRRAAIKKRDLEAAEAAEVPAGR
eukprot:scaffold41070_cov59-Phaeocystis_antarctica.AAC.1